MSLADDILARELFPTNLDTQGIRERVPADIRRRALFSAKTTEMQYLARMREVLAQYVDGEIGDAEARSQLRSSLLATGYEPGPGETGLRDRSSERRLNLILQTNRATAASCAQLDAQTPALLELFPAWRLERFESRMRPRADWAERWRAAGQAVEWEGASRREMVALKSSPIWQALGSGAGGFDDTLGNAYPPFAFGSGLSWTSVGAEEAVRLGLSSAAEVLKGRGRGVPGASLSPTEQEIADVLRDLGSDFASELMRELV